MFEYQWRTVLAYWPDYLHAAALALQITDATNNSSADLAKYVPDYYGSIADYASMGNQVLAQAIQDRV